MPRSAPFDEGAFRAAAAEAVCWADLLRALGYRTNGSNFRTVQRWARNWSVPTQHFDKHAGQLRAAASRMLPLEQVMVANSTYPRGCLKQRLFATGIKQRRCEMCGQDEIWQGDRMSLVLDHINGVSNDHRLENLRIVCPNCAATLDTHCGRNLPRERTCPTCHRTFVPRNLHHRYCSQTCFGVVLGGRFRGVAHVDRRKVERPTYAELLQELATMSVCAVGRKYGVSDNAVRKWVRWYEAAAQREASGEASSVREPPESK